MLTASAAKAVQCGKLPEPHTALLLPLPLTASLPLLQVTGAPSPPMPAPPLLLVPVKARTAAVAVAAAFASVLSALRARSTRVLQLRLCKLGARADRVVREVRRPSGKLTACKLGWGAVLALPAGSCGGQVRLPTSAHDTHRRFVSRPLATGTVLSAGMPPTVPVQQRLLHCGSCCRN